MATFSSVQRRHVLQAIEEYDRRGEADFLGVYGFAPSSGYRLQHDGRDYDSKAILGVAHRYATGRIATDEEFHGGLSGVAMLLRRRGFDVTGGPASGTRDLGRQPARVARAPRRASAPERPAAVCPSCFMTLPATGLCDQCG